MFSKIFYDLQITENKYTYEYRLLTGQYLAPANPFRLLLIRYLSLIKYLQKSKNDRNK